MKRLSQEDLDVITRVIRDQGFSEDLGRAESLASRALEEWELREEIFWKQSLELIGSRKVIGTLPFSIKQCNLAGIKAIFLLWLILKVSN